MTLQLLYVCIHVCMECIMKCPECNSTTVVRIGFIVTKSGKKQRYKCNKCGRTFYAANSEPQPIKTNLEELEHQQ